MQALEPLNRSADVRDPQITMRLAWLTLVLAFAVFLAAAGTTLNNLWQWYQSADDPRESVLVLRSQPEGLSFRPAGRTVFQGVADGQPVLEGETVRALPTAGYGQVATLKVFDGSQFDLWAGSSLDVETLRTSRWHQALQRVTVLQSAGYVRYDIAADQPYRSVEFLVRADDAEIRLAPGGSYSIALLAPARSAERVDGRPVHQIDVAVRSGTLTVTDADGSVLQLGAGQRTLLDESSRLGPQLPAEWELLRDGAFTAFSELEYNNTTNVDDPALRRSTTWLVSGTPDLPIEQRGFFRLAPICPPPDVDNRCASDEIAQAAWFYRLGGQTSGFVTSLRQMLGSDGAGIDISEYRSLRFSLWVRVLYQSLSDAGDRGTECPVMVRIIGRRSAPLDPDEERVICFYTPSAGATAAAPVNRAEGVTYVPLEPASWLFYRIDLRDAAWMPEFRYLRSIEIYANGHDYDSRVTEVSLLGVQ
jgi:hypothetical protein